MLNRVEPVCLVTTASIAFLVLCGWLVPAFGTVLPDGWWLMQPDSALSTLLCAACLTLTRGNRSHGLILAGRVCASGAILLAGVDIAEHWGGYNNGLSTLLIAEDASPTPKLMAVQTAFCFMLLGLSLIIDPTRQHILGHLLDFLSAALTLLIIILISGYIYDAVTLIGQSETIRTSPQTLICITLLTFVLLSRRAPYGLFSVFVGMGIGSHFARIMAPFSIAAIYIVIYVGTDLFEKGTLSLPSATAVTASGMMVILIFLILLLARRINVLESDLRESSLSDELTRLHNFRGFHLLGEQLILNAQRNGKPVSVIFFDVDGLKEVNDKLGHKVGSDLLLDIATLLLTVFRDSDIVGRIGGDEFAVVAQGNQADIEPVLRRFNNAMKAANLTGNKPYQLSCSLGMVSADPQDRLSLTDLLARADREMYKDKKQRQALPSASA